MPESNLVRLGATTAVVTPYIGLQQRAASLLYLALLAPCTLFARKTRRWGSVGINFAVRYCCYRNLDGSYSTKYELLFVSRILILGDHQDTGLGRNAAVCWLADKGPGGAVCS